MSGYWAKRQQKAQAAIADKTIAQTEKQLGKYYADAMKKVIADFEATYDKVLAARKNEEQVTPADLYKLDRYWQMQSQLKRELQKLGEHEIALLSDAFEEEWHEVYEATALPSDAAFATVSTQGARAMVDNVWLNDGKSFSQRIWGNTEKLAATLNEELLHCIVTGKKTTELREKLQHRFAVSRNQANTLIRTEAAHIQIEASKQRYQDYGLDKYEFHADTDERTCTHGSDSCKELDGKVFLLADMKPGVNAPPMHPNCRCAVLPVIDEEKETIMENEKTTGRNKELMDKLNLIPTKHLSSWTDDGYVERGNKEQFLYQLESTSRKKIDKGVKREIKEMVADYGDNMFKQCSECGRMFIKDNPKSNRAVRCPVCQAAKRKADKAAYKKRKRKEEKRKKYQAEWQRKNRAKKKN